LLFDFYPVTVKILTINRIFPEKCARWTNPRRSFAAQ